MGEATGIEWADHTFNPWIGCTKVSPACDHCYAEDWSKRFKGPAWGKERRLTSAANWRQPLKWNREAAAFRAQHGRAPMVFCASLADVFDNQVPDEWRRDLWALIAATPDLIWLLLTKRPQNILKMVPWAIEGVPWPGVWLGTTVENQAEADRRVPHLLSVPAAKRFLSCEPLLGPVDLREFCDGYNFFNPFTGRRWHDAPDGMRSATDLGGPRIDWVIAGGESGREARPSHPDWFRSVRDQCAGAGVPFLFKQWGEWKYDAAFQAPVHVFNPGEGRPDGLHQAVFRLGKKAAGRALDGVIHDGRPVV